jgi:hypothetical protein
MKKNSLVKLHSMRGKGIGSFFRKVGSFLKRTKLISRGARVLGALGVPYMGTVGSVAGMGGLGRRSRTVRRKVSSRMVGKGLSMAGGALRLAGQGRAPVYLPGATPEAWRLGLRSLPMMY